jgi:hypothetical protein
MDGRRIRFFYELGRTECKKKANALAPFHFKWAGPDKEGEEIRPAREEDVRTILRRTRKRHIG